MTLPLSLLRQITARLSRGRSLAENKKFTESGNWHFTSEVDHEDKEAWMAHGEFISKESGNLVSGDILSLGTVELENILLFWFYWILLLEI